MKKISILGSTGSIGKSTLQVIERHPARYKVAVLAASTNHELLLKQIEKFRPDMAALFDPRAAELLRKKTDIPVYDGEEGLLRAASYDGADFVLSAIVGFAGLLPTLAAIEAGKTIGLANKEVLVTAGDFVMELARKKGVRILPVDSEHSAVFQCLLGHDEKFLRSIILTASGGPFAGWSKERLASVQPEEALNHPKWRMGKKITIDSATLMNKGLEVIEAHHLFSVEPERIKVLIHPQSIVHSLIEFVDGSVLAQLSNPDMKAPIAYALSYPERLPDVIAPLELGRIKDLSFSEPDHEVFPCLGYAYEVLKEGGVMPAVLNAANEISVQAFLEGRIGFNDIPAIINKVLEAERRRISSASSGESDQLTRGMRESSPGPVKAIQEADQRAREAATGLLPEFLRGPKGKKISGRVSY